MGTPEFAMETLKALVEENYNVVGVITVPDKPAGRGQKLMESAVKKYAVEKNIPVLQPEKLKSPDFLAQLDELNADLQIVVAFRMLPQLVWSKPKYGTFNLHASLLPQYRGAAPINWAIINGETKSGVTTFFIDEKIDTGEIIAQKDVEISETMNAGDLHDALMHTGAKLIMQTVDSIINGSIKTMPQSTFFKSNEPLKHAPKIFKDDCLVNWNASGKSIYNLIRGLSPYPAAWSNLKANSDGKDTTFKIYAASFEPAIKTKPGAIQCDNKTYLKIACADGWISIDTIQIAGKKRMPIADLLRGFKIDESFSAQ